MGKASVRNASLRLEEEVGYVRPAGKISVRYFPTRVSSSLCMDLLCSALTRREVVWEGELGQLDQHINSNPAKEKQLVGCNIACLFCDQPHLRREVERCPNRPFTCSMCEEYESTYEDVVNSHAPMCKCRPVECPNSCGADNLQRPQLESHVSSQCPLTFVKCEFSDAGCDAKVHRKDLASHLTDNLVTHMSLLAMENKKLKHQVEKAEVEIRKLKAQQEKVAIENRELKQQLKKQTEDF